MSALGLGIGELLRRDGWRAERCQREVGDGEPIADQIAAWLQGAVEALAGGIKLLVGELDAVWADAELGRDPPPHGPERRPCRQPADPSQVRNEGAQRE